MKKIVLVMLLCLTIFTGCTLTKAQEQNVIQSMLLSQEQSEILDLIVDSNKEVHI